MAGICPTSCSTPRTSPVPCAPAPACGLELARLSTASPKKTLPLMAASAVRKTTSGELASSPVGLCSRRAITASPSQAVFSDKNANDCSVTGLHSGRCFYVYKSEVESDPVVTADVIESVRSCERQGAVRGYFEVRRERTEVSLFSEDCGVHAFERSYTLEGSSGEHKPQVIGNLVARMVLGRS